MPENKYQKIYPVHYFDVDWNAELRFGSLLDFLQDSAGEDAARRGFGVEQLRPRGLTWMLSRYRIRLNAGVRLADHVAIQTWPSRHKGLTACREFEIFCNGSPIGAASTAWMLIDLKSRRPVRPKEKLGEVVLIDEQVFAEPLVALQAPTAFDAELGFRVRRADLDLNCHVNNRVFFNWAVEAVEANLIQTRRLQQVDINFMAEVLAGEEVVSLCSSQPEAGNLLCSHLIRRPSDFKELAKLQTLWVPR